MFQKWKHGDFPGSLVVKTPHFHCRGHRCDCYLGNWDPAYCMVQPRNFKKRWGGMHEDEQNLSSLRWENGECICESVQKPEIQYLPTAWSMIVFTWPYVQLLYELWLKILFTKTLCLLWLGILSLQSARNHYSERAAIPWNSSTPYSLPASLVSWAAHSSALSFEVSLVHPTWDYLISSHT